MHALIDQHGLHDNLRRLGIELERSTACNPGRWRRPCGAPECEFLSLDPARMDDGRQHRYP